MKEKIRYWLPIAFYASFIVALLLIGGLILFYQNPPVIIAEPLKTDKSSYVAGDYMTMTGQIDRRTNAPVRLTTQIVCDGVIVAIIAPREAPGSPTGISEINVTAPLPTSIPAPLQNCERQSKGEYRVLPFVERQVEWTTVPFDIVLPADEVIP